MRMFLARRGRIEGREGEGEEGEGEGRGRKGRWRDRMRGDVGLDARIALFFLLLTGRDTHIRRRATGPPVMVTGHLFVPLPYPSISLLFLSISSLVLFLDHLKSLLPILQIQIVSPISRSRIGYNSINTWPPNYPSYIHIPGTVILYFSSPSFPRQFPEH
jgi:hypothetical protein